MNWTWLIIRASGFIAFGLLAASAMLGLLVSTKLFERRFPAKTLTRLHESVSLGSLLATVIHMGALWRDEFIGFGLNSLLVPGAAVWQSLAVSLGVVAMWGALVVTASFYVKKYVGRRMWRALHFGSFGVFVAALAHGVMAGTDTGNPIALALYVTAAAGVAVLTVARIVLFRSRGNVARPTMTEAAVEATPIPVSVQAG